MQRFSADDSARRLVASSRADVTTGNAVDATLVARIASGDRVAMRIFYTRHHARVRRFILRFVDDGALADDLMHETYLHVWRNAAGFAGRGPVSTWLLCVARYKTIQAARCSGGDVRNRGATKMLSPMSSKPTEGRVP
jgi:RNA polymerase sigma-70 factor (ECF subfamily)